jgi:prepilin-type N-terminal cleavage/methylation domain-containing protein
VRHRTRGFTLVEMLAVLGIIVVVMGLGFGLVQSLGRQDALVTSQSLITGALRQIQHVARTTGSPAMARIWKDDGRWRLSQTGRSPIWTETFDDSVNATNGRTGRGLRLDNTTSTAQPLDLRKGLGRFGRAEGFSIRLDILPPQAHACSEGLVIPLVVIGTDADARLDNAQIVVYLVNTVLPVQTAPQRVDMRLWDLRAMIRQEGTASSVIETKVTSIDPDSTYDVIRNPLSGGTWTNVTVSYDGTELAMARDGFPVGTRKSTEPSKKLVGSNDATTVVLGRLRTVNGIDVTNWDGAGTIIDNLRIERHGTMAATTLPGGMTWPQGLTDLRILAQADGTLSTSHDDPTMDFNPLVLTNSSGNRLKISWDGSGIQSSITIPSPSPTP